MFLKRLGVLLGIIAMVLGVSFLLDEGKPNAIPDTKERAEPSAESPALDLTALTERLATPTPLTLEQIDEDERVDAEQVAFAREWLESSSPSQRIAGAEQLAAYPTPEAEKLLISALTADSDPEVRSAAAQSLENFEAPTEAGIVALLNALEDPSENVSRSAFSSIQSLVSEDAVDSSASYKKILAGLRRKQASRRVKKDTRKLIADFLSDLDPSHSPVVTSLSETIKGGSPPVRSSPDTHPSRHPRHSPAPAP